MSWSHVSLTIPGCCCMCTNFLSLIKSTWLEKLLKLWITLIVYTVHNTQGASVTLLIQAPSRDAHSKFTNASQITAVSKKKKTLGGKFWCIVAYWYTAQVLEMGAFSLSVPYQQCQVWTTCLLWVNHILWWAHDQGHPCNWRADTWLASEWNWTCFFPTALMFITDQYVQLHCPSLQSISIEKHRV